MPIEEERISRDIETIAGFNETTSDIGYSRPTFSKAWKEARDYVMDQAIAAGCKVRIDAAGNVHARPESIGWDEKVWLSGSHIDSVPTGGKYDGVIGVVCPLEVLRAAHAAGKVLPLELIIFAEEEGTTFGLGMLGSHAWAGSLTVSQLSSVKNKHAQDYLTAGKSCGVDPDRISKDQLTAADYFGFIEIHAEQGSSMWKSQASVAVVTAINGRRQYAGTITGVPNHAGSARMADRADALAAMADCMMKLESLANELAKTSATTVITCGQLSVRPNAINVIPGTVDFTLDFRAPSADILVDGEASIRNIFIDVSRSRNVTAKLRVTESLSALPMSSAICDRLQLAAKKLDMAELPATTSGALHDAAILAPHLPTAMLFVASKDGISHNPAEFSKIEDTVAAARVLEKVVSEP